jgi:hypothetical protein
VVAGCRWTPSTGCSTIRIGFNRFVMNQLNERLGQFIAAREIDRLNNPDLRVARSLASLFNPVLYPGVGEVLRITQQELAYLVGLSRQRVNEALATLQAQGADPRRVRRPAHSGPARAAFCRVFALKWPIPSVKRSFIAIFFVLMSCP